MVGSHRQTYPWQQRHISPWIYSVSMNRKCVHYCTWQHFSTAASHWGSTRFWVPPEHCWTMNPVEPSTSLILTNHIFFFKKIILFLRVEWIRFSGNGYTSMPSSWPQPPSTSVSQVRRPPQEPVFGLSIVGYCRNFVKRGPLQGNSKDLKVCHWILHTRPFINEL